MSLICNVVHCFFLASGSYLFCGSKFNVHFYFYKSLLISFWFFFLWGVGGGLLGLVIGAMGLLSGEIMGG